MKVFIETTRGSSNRTRYNEDTFEVKETFKIKYCYPYDYGFIIGTNKKNKDCIDCYVLTNNKLSEGTKLDCEPVCMIEMIEDSEIDHKVILKTADYEDVDITEVVGTIKTFIKKVFTQFPDVKIQFGEIKDKKQTIVYIHSNM